MPLSGSAVAAPGDGDCVHLAIGLSPGAFCAGGTHAGALAGVGVFRLDPAGYRWVQQFEARPDQEQIDDALASSTDGLRQKLGAMDRFIDDLRG